MRGSLGSGDKIQRSQIPTEANENGRKKNKLASMRSKVTRMDGIMGPTGAGLDKAEDILPSNSDMVGAWRTSMAQRLAYNVKNLTSKFSCREGP